MAKYEVFLNWIKKKLLMTIALALIILFFIQNIKSEIMPITDIDAMVVLGGSRGPRVEAAVSIIKQMDNHPKVYLTGGALFYGVKDTHHMKKYATSLGATESLIQTIDTAHSTFDDANHLKQYLILNNQMPKNLLIVTSRFHTGRSYWVFKKVFSDTDIKLFIVGADDGINYDRWWLDYNMAEIVLIEKARFLFYRLVVLINPSIIEI